LNLTIGFSDYQILSIVAEKIISQVKVNRCLMHWAMLKNNYEREKKTNLSGSIEYGHVDLYVGYSRPLSEPGRYPENS